ncbi:odorant receptor 74a-like [Drosophila sulfurigaster albostrigata]|uniref:odorant receptor 74a-like n=1 Tax=Drosophila sulfurigaster albostrigata TaxID=89887 RepID=UPI002D21DCF7|nr:odorant receptor 74a-like [Drosophila sulfurigaster albostrigata]
MRFQPRLRNGEIVKLSWSLNLYSRGNPVMWPREDNPTQRDRYIDRFLIVFAFLMHCFQAELDAHYLLNNLEDIEDFSAGLPTILLQTEVIVRYVDVINHRDELKDLLKRFYANIYVSQESDQSVFSRISRQLLGPRLITVFYVTTMLNYFQEFVVNILAGGREMIYKQVYFFDNTKMPQYLILIGINFWVGILIITMLFGDLNLLGELLMHLNACYLQLGKDLRSGAARLLESNDSSNIAADYRRELIKVLQRNIDLNDFAANLERLFTFRLFISFAASALILCVLLFISYKVCVAFITFLTHTNELDMMYYCGDWEQIIYRSDNAEENKKLMKLVILSIELNSTPFSLTGLNYFTVTLTSVVKIVQGAFSYFTFLTSMSSN